METFVYLCFVWISKFTSLVKYQYIYLIFFFIYHLSCPSRPLLNRYPCSILFFKGPQNEFYDHKIYSEGTLGSKLQICCKNCYKKPTLKLIFDDFEKMCDFPPNFCFSKLILGILKFWETAKLKKTIFIVYKNS